jgi:hypothetical protein
LIILTEATTRIELVYTVLQAEPITPHAACHRRRKPVAPLTADFSRRTGIDK